MQTNGWNLICEQPTHQLHAVSWEDLAPQISNHKLEGLIYSKWKKQLPQNWHGQFRTTWKKQTIRNLVSMRELDNLLQLAKNHNIPIILLKGATFLKNLYSDWGVRNLSDIDLLISPSDTINLDRLLKSCGFEVRSKKRWMGNHFKTEYLKQAQGLNLVFEVHTQLFYHHSKLQWWRKQAKNYGLYYELHPDDYLIYLAGHAGFQHTFLKIYWLKDIDLFIRKHHHKLNWEDIFNKAQNLKLKNSLYLTLYITQNYLRTPLPEAVQNKISKFNSMSVRYCAQMDQLWSGKKIGLKYYWLKIKTKDSFWEFLHYAWSWTIHRCLELKVTKSQVDPNNV